MIDVLGELRCIGDPFCTNQVLYHYSNHSRPQYCSIHRLPEMVNVYSKKCIAPDCNRFPTYKETEDGPQLYCVTHKKEGMISKKQKIFFLIL
jgi:hypothetical protein